MASEPPLVDDHLYRWRRRVFRWGIWNFAYRFWIQPHFEGWENVPAEGSVILIGNHIAAADPGVAISFYPERDIIPLAKIETLDTPIMRYFIRHYGAIPINRGEADLKAPKTAINFMHRGYVLMLYIEGTRSPEGLIQGQEGRVSRPEDRRHYRACRHMGYTISAGGFQSCADGRIRAFWATLQVQA
jgi:1-acyl-sn-glycerol-3-phosphate acyltransferase